MENNAELFVGQAAHFCKRRSLIARFSLASLISRAFGKLFRAENFNDEFLIKFHGESIFGYFVRSGEIIPNMCHTTCEAFAAGAQKARNETNRKSFWKKPILAEKSLARDCQGGERERTRQKKSINQITQLPNGPQRQHPCRLNISFLSPRNASTRLESSLVDVMSIV